MSRKPHQVDREATAQAGFKDKLSYVTHAGKEFLGKKDWEIRRRAIYDRDKGFCRICGLWVAFEDMDADHHPVSRGRGGDDSMGNLRTTHHYCHLKTHVQVQLRW